MTDLFTIEPADTGEAQAVGIQINHVELRQVERFEVFDIVAVKVEVELVLALIDRQDLDLSSGYFLHGCPYQAFAREAVQYSDVTCRQMIDPQVYLVPQIGVVRLNGQSDSDRAFSASEADCLRHEDNDKPTLQAQPALLK